METNVVEVVAFVNPSSGGRKGLEALAMLQRKIRPEMVFNLKEGGPGRGLEMMAIRFEQGQAVTVLVCGGDGTFSWLASALSRSGLLGKLVVRLVPVPLGSGNDMSRALGWGVKYPGGQGIEAIVRSAKEPDEERCGHVDVWKVNCIQGEEMQLEAPESLSYRRAEYFCNYLSVGIDAEIELEFNEARWKNPERFATQSGNIVAHAGLGARKLLIGQKRRIKDFVNQLEVDGKPVDIPPAAQSLIFLNIPSYAAGVQPWGRPNPSGRRNSEFSQSMVNDGSLEVMALVGLHHFVGTRVGIPAVRLAQGTTIHFRVTKCASKRQGRVWPGAIPMQADGEPWPQEEAEFRITHECCLGVICGHRHSHRVKTHAKFHSIG